MPMIEQYNEERKRQLNRMRSIMDYVMGALFTLLGLYFLLYGAIGISLMGRKHQPLDYAIGAVFLVYGGWRLYRGYKKNYFR